MKLYRDEGIVLRSHKLGEADRIITVLTRRHGLKRVVAKGVRKTGSRFGARLDAFNRVDFQAYEGRSLDTFTQVETLSPLSRPLAEIDAYVAASLMVETALVVSEADPEPNPALYRLLYGGLFALAAKDHPEQYIVNSFMLRSLAMAGWAMELDECVLCGADGDLDFIHVPSGGTVCAGCRPGGAVKVTPGERAYIAALTAGDWPEVYRTDPGPGTDVYAVIADFTQWHTDRHLKSLTVSGRIS